MALPDTFTHRAQSTVEATTAVIKHCDQQPSQPRPGRDRREPFAALLRIVLEMPPSISAPTARRRVELLLALTGVAAGLTGCSSQQPWWSMGTGTSACGFPAFYRVVGQVAPAGDCAGNLYDPAVAVTLKVGQQVDVHMTEEETARSSELVPMFPVPTSSDSTVLQRMAGGDNATATYRAEAPGTAQLLSPSTFCTDAGTGRQSSRPCPVLTVTVRG